MQVDKQTSDKALKKGVQYGYVPHRLMVVEHPEWNGLPFNIFFTNYRVSNGSPELGSAIYEPIFESYTEKDGQKSMRYRNIYGEGAYINITFDTLNNKYQGEKYVNGELVCITEGGNDWNQFFVQLTINGLFNGEPCKFETINSS